MFRLRRLIAFVLILSVFGYGTAWAFHWHAPAVSDAAHAEQADATGHNDAGGCDHCCHASAHFTGLTHRPLQLFVSVTGQQRVRPNLAAYIKREAAPPLKPPQT
jgi:hypothetical protein